MAQAPSKRLFFKLAEGYLETGRLAEALETAEQGLRSHPGYLSCLEIKGFTLVRLGRWNEAIAILEDVNNRVGGDKVKTFLAMALFGAGRQEAAEALCRDILAANPFNVEIKKLLSQGGQIAPAIETTAESAAPEVAEEAIEVVMEEEMETVESPLPAKQLELPEPAATMQIAARIPAAEPPIIVEAAPSPTAAPEEPPPSAPVVDQEAEQVPPELPKNPRKSRFGRSLFRRRRGRKSAEASNEEPAVAVGPWNGEAAVEEPEETVDAFSDPLQDDQKDTTPPVAEKTLLRSVDSAIQAEKTVVRPKETEAVQERQDKTLEKQASPTKTAAAKRYDPTEGMNADLDVEDIDVFSGLEEDEKS